MSHYVEQTVSFCYTFRSESSKLRTLLNEQHKDGQHAALKQLSALKEEEKKDIRLNAEKDMAILQTKVCIHLPRLFFFFDATEEI